MAFVASVTGAIEIGSTGLALRSQFSLSACSRRRAVPHMLPSNSVVTHFTDGAG